MASTIQIKRSSTTRSVPSSLAAGELAVNLKDKILYVGNSTSQFELSRFKGANSLILTANTSGAEIQLNAPAALAGSYVLTFPADDGTATQVLTTDGNGVLTWEDPGAGGGGTVTSVSGGSGLTGTVTTTGSIDVGAGNGIAVAADSVAVDGANGILVTTDGVNVLTVGTVLISNSTGLHFVPSAVNTSTLTNDAGFTTATGTVTSVSGGSGLTGSITTTGSLAVGAANGILVTADEVSVKTGNTQLVSNATGLWFNATAVNVGDLVNDVGYVTSANGGGTVSSVGSGAGLTGGPITVAGTLAVGAGNSIVVTADEVSVAVGHNLLVSNTTGLWVVPANINTSTLTNDAGFTTATGTVTSVGGGAGLTGSVTTTGSLDVGAGSGITVNADDVAVNAANGILVTVDGVNVETVGTVLISNTSGLHFVPSAVNTSALTNDAGFSTTVGTVTSVAGGTGLTGSVTTTGSLDVGAGNGITVNADDVAVNGANGILVTVDGVNVETVGTVLISNTSGVHFVPSAVNTSTLTNDAGFTTATGTVTSVSGGNGLTGSVTTTGSLDVGAGNGITVATNDVSVDGANGILVTADGVNVQTVGTVLISNTSGVHFVPSAVNTSTLTNDAGFTTTSGTVTSVGGGAGMTGSVTTSGDLAVGAGNGITVAADSVAVNAANGILVTTAGVNVLSGTPSFLVANSTGVHVIGVDAAGTDNSTNVSLAGTPDYLTLAGQVITLGQVDLGTDVTGGLNATAIADGTISNTEFQYLNGVTSNIQTQLDAAGGSSNTYGTHTWALAGEITAATLPSMFVLVDAADETFVLNKFRAKIQSGTSCIVQFQANGVNIPLANATVTTTAADATSFTANTLVNHTELGVVVSANVGTPIGLSVTAFYTRVPV